MGQVLLKNQYFSVTLSKVLLNFSNTANPAPNVTEFQWHYSLLGPPPLLNSVTFGAGFEVSLKFSNNFGATTHARVVLKNITFSLTPFLQFRSAKRSGDSFPALRSLLLLMCSWPLKYKRNLGKYNIGRLPATREKYDWKDACSRKVQLRTEVRATREKFNRETRKHCK